MGLASVLMNRVWGKGVVPFTSVPTQKKHKISAYIIWVQDISPGHFPPEKNANDVVEIEDGMMKQYFSSTSWIDKTIRC